MKLIDRIGNTPLIFLERLSEENGGARVFAKAEFLNPGGSVKDRAVLSMLTDGQKSGKLSAGKVIIDATSGNSGIAYSWIGAGLGFGVKLFMPSNTSQERKKIIRAFGAEIVETNPLESSDGAYLAAKEEAEAHPEIYFYPDQYNNEANPQAHYDGTGAEILAQTAEEDVIVTHFVSVTGTSGTFSGTARRLKDYCSGIKTFSVQPDSPFHGIEGTKHMETTIKPGIYREDLIDGILRISTDNAYATVRRLARTEGVFTGISGGGNVFAALELAKTLPKTANVVTILPDTGTRYLSDSFLSG